MGQLLHFHFLAVFLLTGHLVKWVGSISNPGCSCMKFKILLNDGSSFFFFFIGHKQVDTLDFPNKLLGDYHYTIKNEKKKTIHANSQFSSNYCKHIQISYSWVQVYCASFIHINKLLLGLFYIFHIPFLQTVLLKTDCAMGSLFKSKIIPPLCKVTVNVA